MLYKVILAGGGGTRLAPLSTEENPKQFITLIGEDSLLQTAYKRLQIRDET
jgi:mannose-1-phosphate guanylyltransferase